MSAIGAARTRVAAALAGIGVPVHEFAPPATSGPFVSILPGSPWITPRGAVTLEVVAYANPAGTTASVLTRLEDLTEAVRNALFSAGLAPGDTSTPRAENDAGVVSASTTVTLRVNCH